MACFPTQHACVCFEYHIFWSHLDHVPKVCCCMSLLHLPMGFCWPRFSCFKCSRKSPVFTDLQIFPFRFRRQLVPVLAAVGSCRLERWGSLPIHNCNLGLPQWLFESDSKNFTTTSISCDIWIQSRSKIHRPMVCHCERPSRHVHNLRVMFLHSL